MTGIVNAVRKASPSGGFIRFIDEQWYEVGCHVAREKIGQMFRDLLTGRQTKLETQEAGRARATEPRNSDVADLTEMEPAVSVCTRSSGQYVQDYVKEPLFGTAEKEKKMIAKQADPVETSLVDFGPAVFFETQGIPPMFCKRDKPVFPPCDLEPLPIDRSLLELDFEVTDKIFD